MTVEKIEEQIKEIPHIKLGNFRKLRDSKGISETLTHHEKLFKALLKNIKGNSERFQELIVKYGQGMKNIPKMSSQTLEESLVRIARAKEILREEQEQEQEQESSFSGVFDTLFSDADESGDSPFSLGVDTAGEGAESETKTTMIEIKPREVVKKTREQRMHEFLKTPQA